jgi:hypothetical protein
MFVPNLVKLGQMVRTLKVGTHKDTELYDILISLILFLNKEKK